MQQQAEGIGPEAVVTQAICLERILEVFQVVLGLATIDVPVIERQRRIGP